VTPKSPSSDLAEDYRKLLAAMSKILTFLDGVGADPRLIESYRRLLRYLRSRPPTAIAEILGTRVPGRAPTPATKVSPPTEDEIARMTMDQIIQLASNPDVPRKNVERIAIVRFGMTKGGLSVLRNRDALLEKLRTLVRNEDAHDSIARAATRKVSEGG
jgi:hypothetical protein